MFVQIHHLAIAYSWPLGKRGIRGDFTFQENSPPGPFAVHYDGTFLISVMFFLVLVDKNVDLLW